MRLALKVAFSAICLILLSNKITAQNDLSISIFYKYDYRSFLDKQEFPFGIGSSISKKFSNKLILSAGLEYSHYSHEYNNKITPGTYRTREVFRESIYSLNIGLSYPLLDKKFDIRLEVACFHHISIIIGIFIDIFSRTALLISTQQTIMIILL